MDDKKTENGVDHGEMIRNLIAVQVEMIGSESTMFDYLRHLNIWASQACSQLWSLQQELSAIRQLLAEQRSADGGDCGSADVEGKKA